MLIAMVVVMHDGGDNGHSGNDDMMVVDRLHYSYCFFFIHFPRTSTRCLEAGLKYRYHEQWDLILQVIGVLFEVL